MSLLNKWFSSIQLFNWATFSIRMRALHKLKTKPASKLFTTYIYTVTFKLMDKLTRPVKLLNGIRFHEN